MAISVQLNKTGDLIYCYDCYIDKEIDIEIEICMCTLDFINTVLGSELSLPRTTEPRFRVIHTCFENINPVFTSSHNSMCIYIYTLDIYSMYITHICILYICKVCSTGGVYWLPFCHLITHYHKLLEQLLQLNFQSCHPEHFSILKTGCCFTHSLFQITQKYVSLHKLLCLKRLHDSTSLELKPQRKSLLAIIEDHSC